MATETQFLTGVLC